MQGIFYTKKIFVKIMVDGLENVATLKKIHL